MINLGDIPVHVPMRERVHYLKYRKKNIDRLVQSKDSSATFSLDLADDLDYYNLYDNILTVFVDKKAGTGTERISKSELRHIKKQLKSINKYTPFEVKSVRKKSQADVALVKFNSIKKDLGSDGLGSWVTDPDEFGLGISAVIWEDSIVGNNRKRSEFDTRTTISHEIGHMLGLDHPVTDFFGEHPNTIMGGDEAIELDGPFLTQSDLNLIKKGWQQLHSYQEML